MILNVIYNVVYKIRQKVLNLFACTVGTCYMKFWLYLSGARIGEKMKVCGLSNIHIYPGASVAIGNDCRINSGFLRNSVGGSLKFGIWVNKNACLTIKDNVGISNATISCFDSIEIGNNCFIGGGVCIYDTDFHAVSVNARNSNEKPVTKPVVIGDNVFIGAHSIILKGVIIGEGAVIGAGSVVTKPVPENEIWAGNPARFIKKVI